MAAAAQKIILFPLLAARMTAQRPSQWRMAEGQLRYLPATQCRGLRSIAVMERITNAFALRSR